MPCQCAELGAALTFSMLCTVAVTDSGRCCARHCRVVCLEGRARAWWTHCLATRGLWSCVHDADLKDWREAAILRSFMEGLFPRCRKVQRGVQITRFAPSLVAGSWLDANTGSGKPGRATKDTSTVLRPFQQECRFFALQAPPAAQRTRQGARQAPQVSVALRRPSLAQR